MNLYSDRALIPADQDPVVLLAPFWPRRPEDVRDPNSGRYDRDAAQGRQFFQMTTLAAADFAVLPVDWGDARRTAAGREAARAFVACAWQANKTTLVLFCDDSDEAVPLSHTLRFRTALHRSRRLPHEFAMPAWSEDSVAKYLGGRLPIRSWSRQPVVGFCGRAPRWVPGAEIREPGD
jgi:hypothetical protein